MTLKHIPPIALGPGSQPPEADGARLECLDLPRELGTYQRPVFPGALPEAHRIPGALKALEWLQAALDGYSPSDPPRVTDISHLDVEERKLLDQVLGEGEVSLRYRGEPEVRVQESVLAGVWRTLVIHAEGEGTQERLEVSPVPELARRPPLADRPPPRLREATPTEGVASALPILVELEGRLAAYRPGDSAYVVNLSLLPLAPEDVGFLEHVLGRGPVSLLSRGYGDCRITSAAVAGVWWVRYHNSLDRVVLDTLEVVDVPQAACAAAEDIADSARRLREILDIYPG
jgi:hydrogenase-1 operon protein HyaF